ATGLLGTRFGLNTDASDAHHVYRDTYRWTPLQLYRWPLTDRRWCCHDDSGVFSPGAADPGGWFPSALARLTPDGGRDVVHVWYHVSDRHAHGAQTYADSCLGPLYAVSSYWWQYGLCTGSESNHPPHGVSSGSPG